MITQDLALLVGILVLLGSCGWWSILPFRKHLGFPVAAAPLAGTVLVPLASLAVSVPLSLPIGIAAAIAIPPLIAASAAATWRHGWQTRNREWLVALSTLVVLSVAAVWFVMRTDLIVGAPGLSYFHGSDHLGYANLADWIRAGARNISITVDTTDWYSSWPQVMLTSDPRFGSVTLLAIVGAISGRSSAFAYDLTCAVVLVAMACGLAGMLSRRRLMFVSVAVGIFCSYWFDWSRTGYLGKVSGMPATVLVAGLYMVWTRLHRSNDESVLDALVALLALSAGTALMFSGIASAFLLATVGVLFVATRIVINKGGGWWQALRAERESLMVLVLLVGVCVLGSGTLARPLYYGYAIIPWSWFEVGIRALELESLMMGQSRIPAWALPGAAAGVIGLYLALAVTAWRNRLAEPMAWLAAPLLLFGAYGIIDARWHAMNFIGVYGTLVLCGAAALEDSLPSLSIRRAVAAMLIALVVLHLPRFEGAARLYGGDRMPEMYRFSSAETEALATAVSRAGGTYVDVGDDVHMALFLAVELGRRGLSVQWSEATWKRLLGYRRWPVPAYSTPAALRITKRSAGGEGTSRLLLQTLQYDVFRNSE